MPYSVNAGQPPPPTPSTQPPLTPAVLTGERSRPARPTIFEALAKPCPDALELSLARISFKVINANAFRGFGEHVELCTRLPESESGDRAVVSGSSVGTEVLVACAITMRGSTR